MRVYDNLHWLNGRMSNAFLYQDENGWVLIDTGSPGRIDAVAYLQSQGAKAEDLTHILITHADVDHSGNVATIAAQTGATVIARQQTAELLRQGAFAQHDALLVDKLVGRFMSVDPVDDKHIEVVEDGQELALLGGLEVIATPGHTPDHTAYWSPSTGILFAGDAIQSRGRLTISGRFISYDYDQARLSAIKLADLSPAIFACGHGKPYLHSYDDLMGLLNAARAG